MHSCAGGGLHLPTPTAHAEHTALPGHKPDTVAKHSLPVCCPLVYSTDGFDIPINHIYTSVQTLVACERIICIYKMTDTFIPPERSAKFMKGNSYGAGFHSLVRKERKERHRFPPLSLFPAKLYVGAGEIELHPRTWIRLALISDVCMDKPPFSTSTFNRQRDFSSGPNPLRS